MAETTHGMDSPCGCKDCQRQYDGEEIRINKRRKALKLDGGSNWGLALSGGGIRSATFCLGVLQAMARAAPPPVSGNPPAATTAPDPLRSARERLLARFDYLSTVSGGGYIGSFFCSLFQIGRLRPQIDRLRRLKRKESSASFSKKNIRSSPSRKTVPFVNRTRRVGGSLVRKPAKFINNRANRAAQRAFRVLDQEPPGRIRTGKNYERASVGDGPMAWLRENGRYLTPSGAGDMLYGLALAIRNWLSVHFVIGMPIFALLVFLALLQLGFRALSVSLLGIEQSHFWNSLWWLPTLFVWLWLVPCSLAFWLVYSTEQSDTQAPSLRNISVWCCLLALALMLVIWGGWFVWLRNAVGRYGDYPSYVLLANLVSVALVAALVWGGCCVRACGAAPTSSGRTIRNYRVRISRWLATGIALTLLAMFLFVADMLSAYLWTRDWKLSPAAVLAACIWGVRSFASFTDEKSWLRKLVKLPIATLSVVAGGLLLLLVVVCWGVLLRWIQSSCSDDGICASDLGFMVGLLVLACGLAVVAGLFVGFINLSSLQALYSSRLTRAYLGASNFLRFKWHESTEVRVEKLSVSEALQSDDMMLEQYYDHSACPPLHLINVTVNLTVDPAERLVQRDRQGLPMCIAPFEQADSSMEPSDSKPKPDPYTFIVDGMPKQRKAYTSLFVESEIEQPLTIGHWIATSGAAVSTGLGRQTSMGLSLLLGLANVRLGTWWPARFSEKSVGGASGTRTPWYAKIIPTHSLLFDELFARFHGLNREYLYLSDGGHFENTAAYELLRPERKLRLVVVCDCGADPLYLFGDLANLIRLARLDLGLEIEADNEFDKRPRFRNLNKVIGCHRDFVGGGKQPDSNEPITLVDDQCALLFNVYDRDNSTRNLKCMLLVIKPNLITRMNDDVWHYAQLHPDFPNEPTADQFFDEAQFESYRQLGLNMGELLFGGGARAGETYQDLLWGYLETKFSQMT